MNSKLPPVPPENRSPKGGAAAGAEGDLSAAQAGSADRNLDTQGRQGNIHQNTTHQGHQQDR